MTEKPLPGVSRCVWYRIPELVGARGHGDHFLVAEITNARNRFPAPRWNDASECINRFALVANIPGRSAARADCPRSWVLRQMFRTERFITGTVTTDREGTCMKIGGPDRIMFLDADELIFFGHEGRNVPRTKERVRFRSFSHAAPRGSDLLQEIPAREAC